MLSAGALYVLLLAWAYPMAGPGMAAAAGIPIGVAAWCFGVPGGVLAGSLGLPLHALLSAGSGADPVSLALHDPGAYAGILIGLAVGGFRSMLDRVRSSEERYRSLVERSPLGVVVHDGERILFANPEAGRILGASSEELLGREPLSLVAPEFLPMVEEGLAALRRGERWLGFRELELVRPDGSRASAEIASARLAYGPREAIQTLIRDTGERQRLQRLTSHDSLTDLPNRRGFRRAAAEALRLAGRQGPQGSRVAVLQLELEGFKEVAGALGPHVGDRLVQMVGQRLRRAVREEDLVARFEEEGFGVLLSSSREERGRRVESLSSGAALRVAGRLREVLQNPFDLRGIPVRLKVSIGLALYPEHGSDAEELLTRAGMALRQARAQGGGVALFDCGLVRHTQERLLLEDELRRALEKGELVLHYQPVLDLASGQVAGAEALVRWPHPTRGFIPPGEFVPLAEEQGFVYELDRYVLRRVLQEAGELPGWVAVNLSTQSFTEPGLTGLVEESLAQAGLSPQRLVLEITERLMVESEQVQPILKGLRGLGVRVAVDDFGSGYSALAYLRVLEPDYLKVDRSFTTGLGVRAKDEAVVRALLGLAKSLGLEAIVEGVESPQQLEWLRQQGCPLAQGYHLARPMPLPELRTWVRSRSSP